MTAENDVVTIVFKGPGAEERIEFKAKGKTKFAKLTAAFNARKGAVAKTFRFLSPDGERLKEELESSLIELDIGDQDEIVVENNMIGGARIA
ncbi:hypothetical protein H9P43_008765 [Blastocladiella emersonii ATCC 22665]|nr:hypothetical protein H9P43_008765 [Blastocladiella emersonii ATCC 22665]